MDEEQKGLWRKLADKWNAHVFTQVSGTTMVSIRKRDVEKYGLPKDAELTGRVFWLEEIKNMILNDMLYQGRYIIIQVDGKGPEVNPTKEESGNLKRMPARQ